MTCVVGTDRATRGRARGWVRARAGAWAGVSRVLLAGPYPHGGGMVACPGWHLALQSVTI